MNRGGIGKELGHCKECGLVSEGTCNDSVDVAIYSSNFSGGKIQIFSLLTPSGV